MPLIGKGIGAPQQVASIRNKMHRAATTKAGGVLFILKRFKMLRNASKRFGMLRNAPYCDLVTESLIGLPRPQWRLLSDHTGIHGGYWGAMT